MNNEQIKILYDIETDCVEATIIRCLSYCNTKDGVIHTTTDYNEMRRILTQNNIILVGHFIYGYDIPVCEKILGIKITCPFIDTLSLSWILYNSRESHNLNDWGIDFGIAKPKIVDYANQDIKEIIHRCEEDIKINLALWKKQALYLYELYDKSHDAIYRFLDYIQLKLEVIQDHQKLGVNFDKELCIKSLKELEKIKEEKTKALQEGMPKRAIKSVKFPPKIMYKKDGSPSENRLKWLLFLKEQGLPDNHNQEVEYISDYEEPNCNSHSQIKELLFNLGWKPIHYKYVNQEGSREKRKIPQIKEKDNTEGGICPSIIQLFPQAPYLENLEGLSILSHRISLLKGFLRDEKNGRLYQGIHSMANTWRDNYSGIVNLPLPSKIYAENIRKCFKADEGKILISADLSSLENYCKYHFTYPYDKKFVETNLTEGFDSHLDLGLTSGIMTQEEVDYYLNYNKETDDFEKYSEIKQKRAICKTCNYALVYGSSPATLARNTGINEKLAKKVHTAYWKINQAVIDFTNSLKVKELNGQKWLLNPVNNMWYFLRADKDKFSLVNQSLGNIVFTTWLKYCRQLGLISNWTMHDEFSINCLPEEVEENKIKILKAIDLTNQELKLNVKITCDIQKGLNYAETH